MQLISRPEATVEPKQIRLLVRCIAEQKNDQWQAFSLEFGLAAQGDTLDEVKHRLEKMIWYYVYDALIGEDREHAWDLLSRRASARVYFKYYLAAICSRIASLWGAKDNVVRFKEPLALEPRTCLA